MDNRVLKRTSVLSASAILMLVTTGTAQAAGRLDLNSGRGYGGHDTWSVYACDTRADGWGVRTYYELSDGSADLVGDANGSSSGCGSESTRAPVVWFAVCAGPNGADSECKFL